MKKTSSHNTYRKERKGPLILDNWRPISLVNVDHAIFDIMDFTAKQDILGLLIIIDFQKAFDSLERNFLQRCLESFNFGPNFIRWVMTFFENIQSCIINNGITSNYFKIERGVRQGDPLSPYLFAVDVETLAIAI